MENEENKKQEETSVDLIIVSILFPMLAGYYGELRKTLLMALPALLDLG